MSEILVAQHQSQAQGSSVAGPTNMGAWSGYAAAVFAYAVLFGFWQAEPVPLVVHALGVLIWAICLIPMVIWQNEGRRTLPMFELVCVAYALQFSLPLYTRPNAQLLLNQVYPLPWEATQNAVLLAMLGISAMIAAYYLARRVLSRGSLPQVDLPMSEGMRTRYILLALLIGVGVQVLQIRGFGTDASSGLGAFLRLGTYQAYIALALLAYRAYAPGPASGQLTLLLYSATGVNALLGLISGALENALTPAAVLFIVTWHARRKVPWQMAMVAIVFFLLLNPVKNSFRREAWYTGEELGLLQRVAVWSELLAMQTSSLGASDLLSTDSWLQFEKSLRDATARLDLVHKFAHVQDLTPAIVPYYGGETYSYLVYGWIPRFLWPDKPTASSANNTIDVDYMFLYPFQTGSTNIGIGHLPEAYANFGVWGLVVILAVHGTIFAALGRMLNGARSDAGRAIYLALMVYFLNGIGSSSVILFGSLVQNTLASVVILRLFATGFRTRPLSRRAPATTDPAGRQESARATTSQAPTLSQP